MPLPRGQEFPFHESRKASATERLPAAAGGLAAELYSQWAIQVNGGWLAMHATEYLRNPEQRTIGSIVVTYGAERFLRQNAIQAVIRSVLGDDDAGLTRLDGRTADLASVLDELRTISMWGDRRLVIVEEADEFVSNHRAELERYVEKPAKKSVLLLDVKSWPKTTRLYKAVALVGLDLDCGPLKPAEAARWLVDEAKSAFGKTLARDAASLMVELVGPQMGLLAQELGKVASYAGERTKIDTEDVAAMVGGWKLQTTWQMLDALQEGRLPVALEDLDKLLRAGENALMLLGGVSYSYRKLAQATELTRAGRSLGDALADAGVFGNKIPGVTAYLRRMGRPRAERFCSWLLEADGQMKGGSRHSDRLTRERVELERLLVQLGSPDATPG